MSYAYNNNNQKQALIGTIMGLMKELQTLAPHPDMPSYKGPLFIASNPNFKIANDNDGMLGSMILESLLSGAISEAISKGMSEDYADLAQNIDMTAIIDCYSEYISDVEGSREQKAAHGQGTMARMSGKSISKGFNMRASISEGMQKFMEDLPKRMTIERNMAYYAKQLDNLGSVSQYKYETPRPSFAA